MVACRTIEIILKQKIHYFLCYHLISDYQAIQLATQHNIRRTISMLSTKGLFVSTALLAAVGAILLARPPAIHSEEALLSDWSAPPPWPIFIALNTIAGAFHSMANALTPPPIRMIDYAFAYKTSRLAHLCKAFGIADFLADGPKTVAEIAAHTQTQDHLRVERIMFAMAADEITQLDPSLKEGDVPRFVNSALSATLRLDHPNSVAGMVGHLVQDGYESFGRIEEMLGPNPIDIPWDLIHTEEHYQGGKLWKFFEDHPEREEQFGRAMNALEGLGGASMAEDGAFHRFSRIIDIGGSRGHFLYKILKNSPDSHGILFDRAPVLENAKESWNKDGGAFRDGTHERMTMVAGDFFDANALPKAQDGDVYLMRYILHDWDEAAVLNILGNIRLAMMNGNGDGGDNERSTSTLMIGECAIPDRTPSIGQPPAMYKIDMLMMNIFGGALERTPAMWKELLNQAGFDLVAIHPTRSLVHFVEAVLKK